jgi:hypothetical protein
LITVAAKQPTVLNYCTPDFINLIAKICSFGQIQESIETSDNYRRAFHRKKDD